MQRKPLADMLAALRQPIPDQHILQKDTGSKGFKADYINVTVLKDLVDLRIGAGNWASEIVRTDALPEVYVVIVRVTIYGSDYVCAHDGTGVDDGHGYGDIASNAYAQALKRAFESFGIARELWRKEEDHSGLPSGQPPAKPIPTNPLAKSVSELVTPKQVGLIRSLCRDLSIDLDTELRETLKLECKVEELSRRAASAFIDHLKQMLEARSVVSVTPRSH